MTNSPSPNEDQAPMTPHQPGAPAFEAELAALIDRHGRTLTDSQIITALERALDAALVLAGDAVWDCTICGGQVDLRNPIKPTAQGVFRGHAPDAWTTPPVDMLGQRAPTVSEWKTKDDDYPEPFGNDASALNSRKDSSSQQDSTEPQS